MSRKLTQSEFLERAKAIHGNKYDYSKSVYINSGEKIVITCRKHGDWITTPRSHVTGKKYGCKLCGYESVAQKRQYSNDVFIAKAKEKHGDKYDYSKTQYISSKEKVIVTCKQHGDFLANPSSFIYQRLHNGCPICKNEKIGDLKRKTLQEILDIHGGRFDIDYSTYQNNQSRIKVFCKEHGWFKVLANVHFRTKHGGCKHCRRNELDASIEQRTERYSKRHKERSQNDPIYVLKRRMRSRLRQIFRAMALEKNVSTPKTLGCDYEFLKTHIERQFHDGMSWDRINEIHLDHVIPLATAKTEADVIALNHFTNLRPMWAKDNLAKGDAIHYLI